jgi:acyl carrier protein
MDIKPKIKEVLVNLLKVKPEELKDDVSLVNSIGVDSTEMVEAVIALEKAFGAKLSPREITKNSSLNDIEKVIQAKLGAK